MYINDQDIGIISKIAKLADDTKFKKNTASKAALCIQKNLVDWPVMGDFDKLQRWQVQTSAFLICLKHGYEIFCNKLTRTRENKDLVVILSYDLKSIKQK